MKCDQCDYQTGQKISLRRHQLAMHGGHKEECSYCDKKYKWAVDLRRHVTSNHTGQKFSCNDCEKVFSIKKSLNAHKKSSHLSLTKNCDFSNCNFHVNHGNNKAMNHHKLMVHGIGEEPTIYECQRCNFNTTQKSQFSRHNNDKHLKICNYQCYVCDFKTSRRYLIKKHITSKHKE